MTWLIRNGRLIERGSVEDYATRASVARSALGFPSLIRDQMDGVRSMLDGHIYESKSALKRSYKAGGVRIVERGEGPVDYARERPRVSKAEIWAAVQKVRQGYKPSLEAATSEDLAGLGNGGGA